MAGFLYAIAIGIMGWMAYRGTYLLVCGWPEGLLKPLYGAGLLAGAFALCAALALN